MTTYLDQYDDFVKWFEVHHPDLFEKYHGNIDLPINENGWVTVNNSFRITNDEQNMLLEIVRTYYNEHNAGQ